MRRWHDSSANGGTSDAAASDCGRYSLPPNPALHALRLSRYETPDQPLKESAMKVRRAQQPAAPRANPAEHGVEDRAALIAARQLRGLLEEDHAAQDVLTGAGVMLQS